MSNSRHHISEYRTVIVIGFSSNETDSVKDFDFLRVELGRVLGEAKL